MLEAKLIEPFGSLSAVRAAVGQLLEYRSFIGPRDAVLCILLDGHPGKRLVEYVENDLGLFLLWLDDERNMLRGGPKTAALLGSVGVRGA